MCIDRNVSHSTKYILESWSGHGDLAEWELGLAEIGVALVSKVRVQFSQSQHLVSTADAAQQVLCFISWLTSLKLRCVALERGTFFVAFSNM
jgi:hypothetical protein